MKTKMRNTLLGIIVLSSSAFAGETVGSTPTNLKSKESGTGEKCFNESTHLINLGIGIGGGSYYSAVGYDSYSRSPALSITYEQPWSQKLGPGFLGVGGYLGYQNAHYRNNHYTSANYYYEHNWNYMMLAGRAAYHWDVLNSEKAEVYAGAIIGLRIQSYNYVTNNPNSNGDTRLNEGNVYPIFSAFAGARWYFAKNVAFYGEVGSGISYLTGGLSFKF